MSETVLEWGIQLVLALQGIGDWLIGPMNAITATGYVEFYLLVLPALYWCLDSELGIRVGIGLLTSVPLNSALKIAFHGPRPYWIAPQVRLLGGAETSFGLPSGHAQHATVLWGTIGAALRRWWGILATVTLILLIGFSRAYLGVHLPTDVLVGWAVGALWLGLLLGLEAPVRAWLARAGATWQTAIAFAVSLISVLAGVLTAQAVQSSWSLPDAWVENAALQAPDDPIDPLSADDLILSAGAFFGLACGAIWFYARRGFDVRGSWIARVGRYLIGGIGVLVLWQGLGALFDLLAADATPAGYVLRYVRYALIGAWISVFAPLIFIRLGLAKEGRS